jgi:hypothetical protein
LRADRAGLAVAEVPSFEAPRRAGTSNLHAIRDGRRVLRTIIAERFRPQPRLGADAPASPSVGFAVVDRAGEGLIALPTVQPSLQWGGTTRPSPRRSLRGLRLGLAGVGPAADRHTRISATRTANEHAMTAALVWSLAVKHRDERLRAIALADYREARRQAAAALPVPGSSWLQEIRQELTALRPCG